jgi:hypothetical protein
MNKTDIVEIMQRRIAQFMVLSVVFVGMMVFLVLTLIEEAQARIDASVFTLVGPFPDVKGEM